MEIYRCVACGNIDQSKIVHLVEEGYSECLACRESLIEVIENSSITDDTLLAEQIIKENDNSLFY